MSWLVRAVGNVPKTGQTTSYGARDDGALRLGTAWPNPRFQVGTGAQFGCVTDLLTGLTWAQVPGSAKLDWSAALDAVQQLNKCGFADWRMPNLNELESLIDYGQDDNALWLTAQGFSNVDPQQHRYYWASTSTGSQGQYNAWMMDLRFGFLTTDNKAQAHHVWPVRGGL